MDEESALAIGGYRFSAKNLIVIGLILVGLFLAYVIFHRPKAATATPDAASSPVGSTGTGGTEVTNDPSAIGSLQTQLEATQQSNLATQQAVSGLSGLGTQLSGISSQLTAQGQTLGTINTNAANAARDSAGARTDASIALNEGKQILANQKAGKGFSTAGPAMGDVAHISASGLGL